MIIIFCITGFSFVIALWMSGWVMSKPEGPPAMREVATAIREGVSATRSKIAELCFAIFHVTTVVSQPSQAEGFLATQYAAIAKYAFLAAGLSSCCT